MKKIPIIIIGATVLIFALGIFFFSGKQSGDSITNQSPPPLPENLEYYWGSGCPKCKNVQDFMDTWEKRDEVKIDKFEVWYNKQNQNILALRGLSCGITGKNLGVPLLFTPEGECILGDVPIIDFLKDL